MLIKCILVIWIFMLIFQQQQKIADVAGALTVSIFAWSGEWYMIEIFNHYNCLILHFLGFWFIKHFFKFFLWHSSSWICPKSLGLDNSTFTSAFDQSETLFTRTGVTSYCVVTDKVCWAGEFQTFIHIYKHKELNQKMHT